MFGGAFVVTAAVYAQNTYLKGGATMSLTTTQILTNAKAAKSTAMLLSTEQKNTLLLAMADSLCDNCDAILAANALDLQAAEGSISPVMTNRLRLTKQQIHDMAHSIRHVATLPDPIGETLEQKTLQNGLIINKRCVPIGVIAIIYESRPNVTADAAALCLKSGNVCILRGGKEAYNSNAAICTALRSALNACSVPEDLINLIEDTSRASAKELMEARGFVDLLIPRGGAGLIRACVDNAKVPCIETGTGICHIYVDKSADFAMAASIVTNAKTSRPSVCNAAEVCLVHADIAAEFLPLLQKSLCENQPVQLKLCPKAAKIIDGVPAGDDDFDTEFLDYILAVKVVDSVEAAVQHIALHSTGHSEAIITNSSDAKQYFCNTVDSACVYVNASTRFTDGGEFGLGCEIGISTQKLGARGPMGLKEMTCYKYCVEGTGQVR